MPVTDTGQIIENDISALRDDLMQTRFANEMLIAAIEMLRQQLAEAQAEIERLGGRQVLTEAEAEKGRRLWAEMDEEWKRRIAKKRGK